MAYVEYDIESRNLIIQSDYSERELIKEVPGVRWDADNKFWYAPVSWGTCVILRGVFGNRLQLGPFIMQWATEERKHQIDPAMAIRDLTDMELPHLKNAFPDLYDFQRVGVEFLRLGTGGKLLGDEMGTGKTCQTLSAMRVQVDTEDDDRNDPYYKHPMLPAIVICPNSVKQGWATEAARWLPEATPYIIRGGAVARRKILAEAIDDPRALVIINFESVRTVSRMSGFGSIRLAKCKECDPRDGGDITPARCETHVKELNVFDWKTVVIDEAHKLKDPKSKQTRACWAILHGKSVTNRWALTGTPIANNPSDLWAIMHGIMKFDAPAKTRFIDRYCLMAYNPFGGMDIAGINPHTKEEFFKILDPRFRRMPKALVLKQLPEKIRETRYVDLTPKQRKIYNDLSINLLASLGEDNDDDLYLVAENNLTAQIRLMQISSSMVSISGDPDDIHSWDVSLCEPSPKLDAMEEELEALGDEPVVIAAESRQLIELAAKRLDAAKISYGMITGTVNEMQRARAIERFNNGQIRVMLITLKAGGTGLNLQHASNMIFLQRSWSMVDNKQGEDRIHRIGSEKHESVNIIDIIANDTIEEEQIQKLIAKLKMADEINRDAERIENANELAGAI